MKILSLNLKAYGPFTDQTLELASGNGESSNGGMTVVYGRNEAGKSSALQAIHDMLFGFPHKAWAAFGRETKHLRVGGSLLGRDGRQLDVLRRKTGSDTLRTPDDQEIVPEEELRRLLGGCTSDLFRSMFGISHETLRKGGREIAAGEGDVGELLFVAGGAADFRQVQQRLSEEAKEYWTPRKGKIRDQLKALTEARRDLRKSSVSVQDWKQQAAALEALQAEERQLTQSIEELDVSLARLERYGMALASIPRWKSATGELKRVAAAPRLPADFSQRRQAVEKALSLAQGQLADSEASRRGIEDRLAALVVSEPLLNAAGQIESLVQRLEQYRSALRDRPVRDAELKTINTAADEILKNLGRADRWIQPDDLRIPATARRRSQDLAGSDERILARVKNAAKEVTRTTEEERALLRRREELPTLVDGQGLKAALGQCQSVLSSGELGKRQRELDQLQQNVEIALAQLRGWSGSLEELERIAVLSSAAIDLQEQQGRNLDNELAGIKRSQQELEQRSRERLMELAALEGGVEIPTEDSLAAARAARGTAWNALQARLATGAVYADSPLIAAFLQAVEEADQVADRMRREADRVAKKVLLQAEQESLKTEQSRLAEMEQELLQKQTALLADWKSTWESVGVVPASPAEMRTWRRQYDDLMKQAADLRRWRSDVAGDRAAQVEGIAVLRAALQGAGVTRLSSDASLEQLKSVVQSRVETLQQQAADVRNLSESLETAQRHGRRALTEQKEAEAELDAWRADWSAQMALLQLPMETLPGEALEELEQLQAFFENVRKAEQLSDRLEQITEFLHRFEQETASVATAVGAVFQEGQACDAVVLDLHTALKEAQRADEQRKNDQRFLEELHDKKQAAQREQSAAEKQLQALCVEAGCSRGDELPAIEQAAEQRRSLEGVIASLEVSLLQLSGGQPIAEFVDEVTGENIDQLTSQIRLDQQRLKELRAQRDDVLQRIRQEQLKLEQMTGSDDAARRAEECEFLSAELVDDLRRLTVLLLSEDILRRAMEQHRQHNQGPILARARCLFSALTSGRMADLVADVEDRKPVVYGVRAGTNERLDIASMSEGTQDQLFLALRLASVEHWLDQHDPMPFIVDDILLTFDDQRAAAALNVLSQLAERTQVIFFTHHQHLVDLARETLPESKLTVQALPGGA